MMESGLSALAGSLTRQRRAWRAGFLLGTVLVTWLATRLQVRLDEDDFLPTTSRVQVSASQPAQREDSRFAAVVLESDDTIPVAHVAAIFGHLERELARVPDVRAVRARLSAAERRLAEAVLSRNALLHVDPADLRAIRSRLTRDGIRQALAGSDDSTRAVVAPFAIRTHDPLGLLGVVSREAHRWHGVNRTRLIDGYLGLPGQRAFLLTLEIGPDVADLESARDWSERITDVLEGARRDPAIAPLLDHRSLAMVSGRTSLVATFDTLYGDVVRVSIAAVLIVLVLLAVLFRGLRIAVVLLATVGLALLMTAAFAAVVFASVSLVSWVFIALIVGLGVDSGIHIAWHCTAQARTGADRAVAMAGALTRPGPAILLGGATSAAAFLALVAIPYPVTREIACLTAFGLIAAVACSLTVLPFMLSLTTRVQRTVRDGPRLLDRFARPRRRARPGDLIPWLVLVGAAAWVAPSIPFEAHPWQLVVRGNQDFARLDNLSTRMGWSLAPLRLVSTGRTPEEALDRDRLAVRRLQHVSLRAGVGIIESLSRWVPDAAEQGEIRHLLRELELTAPRVMGDATAALQQLDHVDPWLEEEYLPRIVTLLDPDTATIDLAHLARRGGDRLIARHLQRVDSGYLASSFVYLRRYPWADGVVPRFVEIAGAGGVLDVPGVTLDGRHLRADDHAPRIRRSLLLATLLAATLVGLTLRFRIRRWSLVALCLAPALCGLSAAVLVVWMLNLQLTLLTVIAGPVLLGIGIDDGIHMVDRLTRRQPLLTILREAGTAMSLTTLTTVGALAALALATFPGIRELGLVLGSGLLVCLLASFLLVPVGWRLLFGSCPGDE